MNTIKKLNKSFLSLMLVLAMTASMLIAAPAKEAKAATAAPTVATTATHNEITDVTVDGVDADVYFQKDNNGVNATFIRILLPSSTAVSTLQNLAFTITTDISAGDLEWNTDELELDGAIGEYTCA